MNMGIKPISEMSSREQIALANSHIQAAEAYQAIYKPKNLHIIEIDGLDSVGKETFANELKLFITKELRSRSNNLKVEIESFPAYNQTQAGKLLYYILRDDDLKEQIPEWRKLFYIDQYLIFDEIYQKAENDPVSEYIYILDRGPISNIIYQAANNINNTESDMFELRHQFQEFESWCGLFGLPDILIVMGINEFQIEEYRQLLESKQDKDNNEVIDYQLKVDKVITNLVTYPSSYLFHSLGNIPPIFSISFKETWGNKPNPNYKPFIDEEYDKIQWTNISTHRLITQTINDLIRRK